ncbi:MAG: GntG family PLP-dependent aldolase [Planctomycetaceae bacterium]
MTDFRSDASTMPTGTMRRAMADAVVGNDDFREDPTVIRLERVTAELLDKEDAVFVHSGTMANLAAVMSAVEPEDSVLIGSHFHILDYEGAAMQRVIGCCFQTLDETTQGGRTQLMYKDAFNNSRPQDAVPRLLCLENTISRLGGTLLTPTHLAEVTEWARAHGMSVHLDGARLLNAAVGLGVEAATLAGFADTVSLALTKAVGAPAGAVVAGSRDITEKLRHYRWMLGGNWKQGGIFAAACLQGLKTVHDNIRVDHANARRLAEACNDIGGCQVDLDRVVTNILFLEVTDESIDVEKLRSSLQEDGFVFGRWKPGSVAGGSRCRLVTHQNITGDDVDRFAESMTEAIDRQR